MLELANYYAIKKAAESVSITTKNSHFFGVELRPDSVRDQWANCRFLHYLEALRNKVSEPELM